MNWFKVWKIKRLIDKINTGAYGNLSIVLQHLRIENGKAFVTIFHMYRSPVSYIIDYKRKEVSWSYADLKRDWILTEYEYCNKMVFIFRKHILKIKGVE